jgi:hypothetical protein
MPNNLVFLGLHFIIGKRTSPPALFSVDYDDTAPVYANSLLISLNTRKELREMHCEKSSRDAAVPVLTPADFSVPYTRSYQYGDNTSFTMMASLLLSRFHGYRNTDPLIS